MAGPICAAANMPPNAAPPAVIRMMTPPLIKAVSTEAASSLRESPRCLTKVIMAMMVESNKAKFAFPRKAARLDQTRRVVFHSCAATYFWNPVSSNSRFIRVASTGFIRVLSDSTFFFANPGSFRPRKADSRYQSLSRRIELISSTACIS